MKPAIILLRILETLFLVGVVITYTVTPTEHAWHFAFLAVLCNFSITSGADQIVISSAVLGYVLSLLGTSLQWNTANRKLRFASLVLALLGFFVCANEIARYFLGHSFQVFVHIPIAVVVMDWMMVWKGKPSETVVQEINTE